MSETTELHSQVQLQGESESRIRSGARFDGQSVAGNTGSVDQASVSSHPNPEDSISRREETIGAAFEKCRVGSSYRANSPGFCKPVAVNAELARKYGVAEGSFESYSFISPDFERRGVI